jgi:transposase
MWTEITRPQYQRDGLRYASDTTDGKWAVIAALMPPRKASRAALAARDWLTVEWLPKYAPELNDIERSWRDLKGHFLAHQSFADIDHLDRAIHQGIGNMNQERQSSLCTNRRIAA